MSITKRALEGQIKIPERSQEEIERADYWRNEHIRKNEEFILKYFDEWSSMFNGMTIKQIYDNFRYKGYAKSYYNKLSAQLGGKHELLKFLLLSKKKAALKRMGYSDTQIRGILEPFRECGAYMVKYKNSSLSFSTRI